MAQDALTGALQEMHACWISNEKDPKTGIERLVPVDRVYVSCEHLMMLYTDHGFLDLFDYVPGMPEEDVGKLFQDSVIIGGRRYASVEWLRKMKRAAGRTKDLADLENLPNS